MQFESLKNSEQRWKLTGNQLANKGYHCRHFSNVQFVKDPNENATVAQRDVFCILWILETNGNNTFFYLIEKIKPDDIIFRLDLKERFTDIDTAFIIEKAPVKPVLLPQNTIATSWTNCCSFPNDAHHKSHVFTL